MGVVRKLSDYQRPPERSVEQRVADIDDGYTRIANELLEAIASADLTARQLKVMLAVARKTYGFGKKSDRIADEQIAGITGISRQNVNKAKKELISMNCLIKDGNRIGVNKEVSAWQFSKCLHVSNLVSKTETQKVSKLETSRVSKLETHKRNTLKIKDKTPHTPQGGDIEGAQKALEYYNHLANASCRSAEPYLKLMTATTARKAYTLQDVCLVTRWAITAWTKKDKTLPKPQNICRVNRFDGYLSDAEKWQSGNVDIDCQEVIDAYNEVTAGRMPPADLYRDREIAIRELVTVLAKKNVDGFRNYFKAFLENARDFYFGGPDGSGWCANFDTLMDQKTLRKVKEGSL